MVAGWVLGSASLSHGSGSRSAVPLMDAHPERAASDDLANSDGKAILAGLAALVEA